MRPALEEEIRQLRARFWSDRDPEGRAFAPLADAYRRAGELEEAVELLEDGRARLPDFAPGHLVAARTFRDRGDEEAAARAYRQVLALDPDNTDALRGAAELAESEGRTADALELWHRAARLEPEDEGHRSRIRRVKRRHFEVQEETAPEAGEATEAEAEREKAEAVPAASSESAAAGREEAAEELEGEEPEVYTRTVAELYLRQGHRDRALAVYRRLVERRPDDEDLRSRLEELESGAGPERAGPEEPRAEPVEEVPEPSGASEVGVPAGADEDLETLAREWADGPDAPGDLSTPFAWDEEEAPAADEASDGPSIASYFERMLAWEPEGGEAEAAGEGGEEVVPIEALAPDPGSTGSDAGGGPSDPDPSARPGERGGEER